MCSCYGWHDIGDADNYEVTKEVILLTSIYVDMQSSLLCLQITCCPTDLYGIEIYLSSLHGYLGWLCSKIIYHGGSIVEVIHDSKMLLLEQPLIKSHLLITCWHCSPPLTLMSAH